MLRGSGPRQGVDTARVISITKSVSRLAAGLERPQAMPSEDEVGRVLAQAYPDRIARKRRGEAPRYQLSNGRGAALRSDDRLARYEWLVAAELDGKAREATIYLAAPVTPAVLEQDLSGHIEEYEEAVWDESGQLLTGSFMDYAMPLAIHLPEFTVELVETPSPHNFLGAKGIGESPTIVAVPAVVNAVVDALAHLGVSHLDIPLTREKVWNAINSGPNAQG